MKFSVFISIFLILIVPIGCSSKETMEFSPLSSDVSKLEKMISFPQKPKTVLFRYSTRVWKDSLFPVPAQDNTTLYAIVEMDEQSVKQMKESLQEKDFSHPLVGIDQIEIKQLLERALSPAELQSIRKANTYTFFSCYQDWDRLIMKRGDSRHVCFLTKTKAFFMIIF